MTARPSRAQPLTGILNIDKPPGMTSHDVVAAIRKASGERRVGHAGTLDPMATGVLLVCLGSATRVTDYLMDSRKTYRARVRFGVSTTTDDAEGEVVAEKPVEVTCEQVARALQQFEGRVLQVPPMFSALKRQGKPLHELARAGQTVELEPREVDVYKIEIIDWAPPDVEIVTECGKGTYIRAIARDLGEALGTGAHLAALTRLSSGRFTLPMAESLEAAQDAFQYGYADEILHPADEALLGFGAFVVDDEGESRIRKGQQIEGTIPISTSYARAYSAAGAFIGLLKRDEWTGQWQPMMVFPKE